MRTRLGHPLAIAGLVWVVLLLPGLAVASLPHWQLHEIAIGSPGEDFQAGSWSRDGTRFIFSRGDQFIVVRVADGAIVKTAFGAFPIWVDIDTIDAEYRPLVDASTHIHQSSLRHGRRPPVL